MRSRGSTSAGVRRAIAIAALAGLVSASIAQERAGSPRIPTVGMPGRIGDLVLPGSELEVLARDSKDPLVLRITRVSPHGTDFRYDLEYVGLEPGKYDLRDALRRRDGTPLVSDGDGALPAIQVEVLSALSPGVVKPHAPQPAALPGFGGYRALLIAGGVAWLAGMGLILFGWRKRHLERAAARWRPRSLSERLRPLVEGALAGKLSREQRSQLELGLLAFWRRKLALEHGEPAHTIVLLREHAEAGPLLKSLEAWLHMPVPPRDVDVAALLAPYRDLPADSIPEIDGAARGHPANR